MRLNKLFLGLIIILVILCSKNVFAYETGAGAANTQINVFGNMAIFGTDAGLAQGDNIFLEDKIIMYIGVLLSFLGLIFLILVIISGVRWMTSGGERETIDKAKAMLKSSVIGLLIILASWVIANGIIELVVKQELLGDSYNKDRPLYPNGP